MREVPYLLGKRMGIVRDSVQEVLSSLSTNRIAWDDLIRRAQERGGYTNTWPDLVRRYAEDLGWVLDESTEVFYRTADGQNLIEIEITLRGRVTPVQLADLQRLFG
jgi:hypothetical protein